MKKIENLRKEKRVEEETNGNFRTERYNNDKQRKAWQMS